MYVLKHCIMASNISSFVAKSSISSKGGERYLSHYLRHCQLWRGLLYCASVSIFSSLTGKSGINPVGLQFVVLYQLEKWKLILTRSYISRSLPHRDFVIWWHVIIPSWHRVFLGTNGWKYSINSKLMSDFLPLGKPRCALRRSVRSEPKYLNI